MRFVTLLSFLSVAMIPGLIYAQPPKVSGYQLNWVDDFNGSSLNQQRWNPQFSTNPTNLSMHAYLPENAFVAGGNLVLLSENQPFGALPYRSGQVITHSTHRFGRFEVRAKLPTSAGMWPAIWLLPDAAWPSQGEIDIMENRGNQPFLTSSAFHYGTNPPFAHSFVYNEHETFKNGSPENFHDSFHTYAAEWQPEQIRFYVDGVHYYTVRDNGVDNFLTTAQSSPMRLIINTAIGGTFLPPPDASTQWPQRFEVDYVYVYNRFGETILDLENVDFETNSGSLSNWTVFGNNGPNVSSDNGFAQSGDSSLRMFGQFNGNTNFSGVEQGVSVDAGEFLRVKASSFVNSADGLSGANRVALKLDYYADIYGAFGSSSYISSDEITLANSSTQTDVWRDSEFFSVVPSGAKEARVAIVFVQEDNASGSIYVDDIEFENLSETDTVTPTVANVVAGSVVSGDEQQLQSSDDSYLRVSAGLTKQVTQAPIDILFESATMFSNPSEIEFQIEVGANTANIDVKVEAFNFDTFAFEEIDVNNVTIADGIVSASLGGDLGRFVNLGNGGLLTRLSFSTTGPTFMFPWTINLDHVQWTVRR